MLLCRLIDLLFNSFCGYLTCRRKRALIRRQVILHTVSSIESLLAPFDVDCCAVAYDVSSNQLWASPRALRAFRHGANVVDSRFNSGNYISRLHKYSGRGFAVVVPGFEPCLVREPLLASKYVYYEDRSILLRVDKIGAPVGPENNEMTLHFAGRTAEIVYDRCDEATAVTWFAKLVVLDCGKQVKRVTSAKPQTCPKCCVLTIEKPDDTMPPLLFSTGLGGSFFLFWGANVADDRCDLLGDSFFFAMRFMCDAFFCDTIFLVMCFWRNMHMHMHHARCTMHDAHAHANARAPA